MTKTVTDVTCPFCGTLCDDLEVEVSDEEKILKYYGVKQGNYDVTNHFLPENPRVIAVDATR
jgi:formylmethanofuran dehydrogenase subunit B